MGRRLQLHQVLKDLIGPNGSVYFQKPPNLQLTYPCIVYARDYTKAIHADNVLYSSTKRYLVTVIDRDPDSEIPDKVGKLPTCSFVRFFTKDDLNHDIYKLYF